MKKETCTIVLFILLVLITGSIDASVEIRAAKRGGIVSITAFRQGILTQNFNPFSPDALKSTYGCFYEPLIFVNEYSGEIKPWLAEKWQWSKDLKTLSFVLKKRVKWNDGHRFSAEDVAFTLNLAKKDPALDRIGIWKKGLSEVKIKGKNSVSFIFKSADTTILPLISGLYIVPQHIWEKVNDPIAFKGGDSPVGTGPFILDKDSFLNHSYRLKRHTDYWQFGTDGKPLPYIDGIQFLSAEKNTQIKKKVISGQVDWGTYSIANIHRTFIKNDPRHNHYWLCEGNLVYLNLNNGKEPFSKRSIRRAVAFAVNPKMITARMDSGALPAGQAGIKKGFNSLIEGLATEDRIEYDPDRGIALLEKEGYTLNSSGIMEKEGKPFTLELFVPAGWMNWITAAQTISQQLKKIGIDARITQAAWPSPFLDNIRKGHYDISIDYVNSGFSPYDQYKHILPSYHFAPIGENASGHSQVRYRNKVVDDAFNKYSQTLDPEEHLDYMKIILSSVIKDTPMIPLFFNPTWFTYSTKKFKGWPNENNPYTIPITRNMAKMPVFLNLQPIK